MKRFVVTLSVLALGIGVVTGFAALAINVKNDSRYLAATPAGQMDTPQGMMNHYTLDLGVYPDSMFGGHGTSGGANPDWVSYGPVTNFKVPAHSVITITVKQYDSGEVLNNDWFAQVHGTLDGTMLLNGQAVDHVDPEHVGHTFTIHGMSGQNTPLLVSVPLPAVAEDKMPDSGYTKEPNVITFTFITGNAGNYVWNCEYPCGDGTIAKFGGPMSSNGYMSGHFEVVGN